MRHGYGQPGVDYPIMPPNPQPRGVPNGFPRTCYHGWYPGICSNAYCRSDPRETGPFRGQETLRLPYQQPPKVYIVDRRGHGRPPRGGMRPPHPHHPYHGGLPYYPHGGHGMHDHYDEEYDFHDQWEDDEDDISLFSSSGSSMMGGHPAYNHHLGHGGHGHYGGGHIPLSHGYHYSHPHQKSLSSISTTSESY